MKKIFATLGAAFFALLPLAACGEQDDGLVTLRINEVTHSVFYAPMYLADSLGYFKEEGIKIELTNGGGADAVMTAVLSGGTDIGFCGPEAAIYVKIGDAKDVPTVFGQLTQRDGSFLVSRKDEAATFRWEDLKGKSILAGRQGGVPCMTFEYILREHGFEDKDINFNFDVSFNNMTAAFLSGTSEYCTMFEPVASENEAAGNCHIVASVGEAGGEVPYTCYIAKQSWLDSHGDVVNGFLRAMLRAIDFAKTQEYSAIAENLRSHFPSTDDHSLMTSVESYRKIDAWDSDMAMSEAAFERLQDIIESAGELTARVQFGDIVDNGYAQRALASLG